ncbi:MAG: ArnT family glycosyltransferase, partial [Actinomycetota bacterium]
MTVHASEAGHEAVTSRRIRVVHALRPHWPLAPILAYGAAIGFWFLPQRGSVFIDEGYQLLEARWFAHKFGYVILHLFNFDARKFLLSNGNGVPPTYAKPLHATLDAVALKIFPGSGPTRVLILQALFGLATVALVYVIAFRLAGRTAAVASATVLATSAGFLAYRRAGLPESDSVFFFTAAVTALVLFSDRGLLTPRRSLIIGFLAGCCFTANDRWYLALPLILLMAVILDTRHRGWTRPSHLAGLTVGVVAGFLVMAFGFEAMSILMSRMARAHHITLRYEAYFHQLRRRYDSIRLRHLGPHVGNIPHTPYVGYIRSFEGAVWGLMIAALATLCAVRPRRSHFVALAWLLVPFLLVSASPLAAPRYMSIIWPALALVAGLGI